LGQALPLESFLLVLRVLLRPLGGDQGMHEEGVDHLVEEGNVEFQRFELPPYVPRYPAKTL